jgi:hypothetical protein
MTLPEHSETLAGAVAIDYTAGRPKVPFDFTADQIIGYDNLVDRVFDFTFDVLSIRDVELRVREGTCRPSVT